MKEFLIVQVFIIQNESDLEIIQNKTNEIPKKLSRKSGC